MDKFSAYWAEPFWSIRLLAVQHSAKVHRGQSPGAQAPAKGVVRQQGRPRRITTITTAFIGCPISFAARGAIHSCEVAIMSNFPVYCPQLKVGWPQIESAQHRYARCARQRHARGVERDTLQWRCEKATMLAVCRWFLLSLSRLPENMVKLNMCGLRGNERSNFPQPAVPDSLVICVLREQA